jgi:DNA-binding NtrC family response regulator
VGTRTILLIEDDNDVREALAVFLRKHGLTVRTANHGLDALRKMNQEGEEPPAVIVVDLKMPIMDGWDFLEKCPEGIPIVVLSGMEDVYRTKAHPDVVAVLQKPVTIDVLVGTLAPFVANPTPTE